MRIARALAWLIVVSCGAPAPRAPAHEDANLRRLREEQKQWQADHAIELARWTPEMHAEAKKLAETEWPTGRAAIEAAMAGAHRKPGHANRDGYRHPAEMFEFFGLTPTMTVLEIDPGAGWITELVAPALAARGKLVVTFDAPAYDEGRVLIGDRFKAFLGTAPEIYGRVELLPIDASAPVLGMTEVFDMVLVLREVHGWVNRQTFDRWLADVRIALKPNGILAVEDHRAKPDADPVEAAKKGYVPEKWLIARIEAGGFQFAGASEINANPRDTKDYPDGVWTLPPVLQLGSVDRERYVAIGESDRMTLKFVRSPKR